MLEDDIKEKVFVLLFFVIIGLSFILHIPKNATRKIFVGVILTFLEFKHIDMQSMVIDICNFFYLIWQNGTVLSGIISITIY